MKKSKLLKLFLIITLMSVLVGCSNFEKEDSLYEINGTTMGTIYSVKIVKSSSGLSDNDYKKMENGIEKTLQEVNRQMSTFMDTSEISQFNFLKSNEWYYVSKDFATVLYNALIISKKSDGYFDVTVGSLVNLWGFGPKHNKSIIPTDEEIEKVKQNVGYENIEVQMDPPAVRKTNSQIYCDLSAIAKGFGVDKVYEFLNSNNIPDYLVEIGGEVRAKGESHLKRMWRIGISTPDNKFEIQKIVSLSKNFGWSVATSGDYRNYFEKDGVRYSHTINPKTGKPITHKLASVTVVHEECMIADAYATAINVLGIEKGMQLAEKENLPVLMLIKSKDGFIEKMTPSFEAILKLNERK